MNTLKSRLIVTAIAMSFAATAGVALAHGEEPTSTAAATSEKMMDKKMDAKEEMLEDKVDMKQEKINEMDSSQPVTDSWITTKVKSELATTENVSSLKISVDTVDGVVFLTGVVDNADMATKAAAVAKTVRGVKKVDASGLKSM